MDAKRAATDGGAPIATSKLFGALRTSKIHPIPIFSKSQFFAAVKVSVNMSPVVWLVLTLWLANLSDRLLLKV